MKGNIMIVSIALGLLDRKVLEGFFFTKKYDECKRKETMCPPPEGEIGQNLSRSWTVNLNQTIEQ